MGNEWTKSDYDIQSWWPSPDSWTKNDRMVACAVYRFDGDATKGSVRGARDSDGSSAQAPWNSGGRRSANAARPSARSSLSQARRKASW